MVWTGTGGGWQARCQHTSCGVDSWAAYKSQLDPSWFPAAAAAVSVSPTPIVSDAWGDPVLLPNTLNSVDPFELELLPNAFRDRVEDISVRMSCPPDFSGMAIVVCAASVIGRRVAIRPKEFDDWTVVPNLWGCGVGRPGLMKTSALQQVMHPLKLLATEAHEKYTKEMKEFLANNELALLKHKQAKKEVAVSLVAGDVDDDALKKQLASAVEEDPPVHRRYIVMDSTYEAVCDMLRESQHGFLQYRDELSGWWATLAKEGQENARSFWLECWNGDGDYYIDRIGRGRIHIPINTISVLGATQPGKIQAYLQGAIKGDTGDDGMIQRHQMLVWPDSSAEWKQYDKWPNADAKRETLAAFRRLDTMTAGEIGATQDAGDDLPYLRFTSEAQRVFDEWLGQLEHQLRSDEDPPYLESHFSKYRSLIPSLALVFHLVDVGEGRIGFDSITRAIRWGTYLASHARRAYGVLDLVTVSAARKILKRIETGELKDGFSIRDIYLSHQTGLATKLDAEAAVELLVDYGWLRTRKVASGGRPSTVCDLHPKIHEYPLRSGTKSIKSPPNTTLGTFGTSSEGVNGNFNHDTETLNEEAAECF
jgi:putative DNA primase/helicase